MGGGRVECPAGRQDAGRPLVAPPPEGILRRSLVVQTAAWLAALAVVAVVLPLLSYGTRDADSRLYAEIAARTSERPVARWIAPEWPARWYGSGLFAEHPVGTFLVPTALAAAGYPAMQAAYVVNAVWQIGSILLLAALARRFAAAHEARALLFLVQLVPIAFTYRVRANQEQLLLVLLLAALYALERTRSHALWTPIVWLSLVGVVLAKGMVGLVALPVCALWLLALGTDGASRRGVLRAWLALGTGALAIGGATVAYEAAYRGVTGTSFLATYASRQVGPAMARQSEGLIAQKAYNLVWYAGRLIWFPFPWSLGLLAAIAAVLGGLRRGGASEGGRLVADARALRGLLFATAVAALYTGLFSLSDRRADRYIFPAYFALAAGGAVAAARGFRPVQRLTEWLATRPAWSPALLWLALVLLHVGAGRLLHLPTIKVWDPSS